MRAHALAVAYLSALMPTLLMAVTQPVWSLVDEAQHADFIVQLGHGAYPSADRTLIDSETLSISQAVGVFRAFYPPGSYPTPDLNDIGLPPAGMSDRANAVWMQRHMWQLSHESVQTPGYYVLMVPVWWAAARIGGPFAAIYTLRIINAFIVATLAPMALAVARMLVPARSEAAVLAAMFVILLPGLALNGTRISNDALASALGGLLVVLSVRWAGSDWSWRRTALAGLIFGAALMVKITLAGLLPALALSAFWQVPAKAWPSRLARVFASGGIAVVCLVPWFVANLHNYGALTPGALANKVSDVVPGPLTASFAVFDVGVLALTYWTGEPWGALPLAAPLALLGSLIALMAPVAVIKLLRNRAISGGLAVATLAVVGMIAVSLLLPVASGFEFVGPGRYIYPALPGAAVLFVLGMYAVLPSGRTMKVVGGAYAAVALLVLGLGAAGLPPRPEAGTGMPPADARAFSVSATGQLEGMTIHVDRVAYDVAAKATWIEVSVNNSGSTEAEWTVPPVVSAGDASATGKYIKSTHLPGDIDVGQTERGWLFVPLDPAKILTNLLHVRFVGVAVNNSQTVRDIEMDVLVPGAGS